jgi:hypothetical protein
LIIARSENLPPIKIPPDVEKASRHTEVFSRTGGPYGADWIACAEVWPHIDESFSLSYFINLSLKNNHEIGDDNHEDQVLSIGDLFVVDPRVRHWLAPHFLHVGSSGRRVPWCGLQWVVPRHRAKVEAQRIVSLINAEWVTGSKYASWKPRGDE